MGSCQEASEINQLHYLIITKALVRDPKKDTHHICKQVSINQKMRSNQWTWSKAIPYNKQFFFSCIHTPHPHPNEMERKKDNHIWPFLFWEEKKPFLKLILMELFSQNEFPFCKLKKIQSFWKKRGKKKKWQQKKTTLGSILLTTIFYLWHQTKFNISDY